MSEETEIHENDAGPAYRVESAAVDGGALAVAGEVRALLGGAD